MEKYLFNDGTNVVREVQSGEELEKLIQSASDLSRVKIWLFSSSEWLSHAEYIKRKPARKEAVLVTSPVPVVSKPVTPVKARTRFTTVVKILTGIAALVAIFLIYNFTRVKWSIVSPLQVTAARPTNVPVMDIDSLVEEIEFARNQKLDRVTLTNLRIRNTWPDRVQLSLKSERDSSLSTIRFHQVSIGIDNSTGYTIDNATVALQTWVKGRVNRTDTIRFNDITYAAPSSRIIDTEYKADSLSVSFMSLRSRAFNFCYSAEKESNYGNLNDRWFCRE